jgi:hypothetical protein
MTDRLILCSIVVSARTRRVVIVLIDAPFDKLVLKVLMLIMVNRLHHRLLCFGITNIVAARLLRGQDEDAMRAPSRSKEKGTIGRCNTRKSLSIYQPYDSESDGAFPMF